jgi:hypothetical protein
MSMKNKTPTVLLTIVFLVALLLSGCGPAKPAALTNDQVVALMDNILASVNAGDYTAFSRDFSPAMKTAIPATQFTDLKGMLQNVSGKYVSCATTPELSNGQGYAVYRLSCKFELEPVIVTVTIKTGGTQVEGLFFDSTNLRKVGQKTPSPANGQ